MSLVQDLRRAYGCPYGTAEKMARHVNESLYSRTAEAVLGLGPIRVHWHNGFSGWWRLDNRPASKHQIWAAWEWRRVSGE